MRWHSSPRVSDDANKPETLGVVRAVGDPDNTSAEFAISVRSDLNALRDWAPRSWGKMIRYCRDKGTGELVGQALPDNRAGARSRRASSLRPGSGCRETM